MMSPPRDLCNIVHQEVLFNLFNEIICWEGVPRMTYGQKLGIASCCNAQCIKHWQRYSKNLITKINEGHRPDWHQYAVSFPEPPHIAKRTYQRLVKECFDALHKEGQGLTWLYVRHKASADQHRHYIIQSRSEINSVNAQEYIHELLMNAGFKPSRQRQVYFEAMKSWEGYRNYIVGLRESDNRLIPPWYGIEKYPYYKSDNWAIKAHKPSQ